MPLVGSPVDGGPRGTIRFVGSWGIFKSTGWPRSESLCLFLWQILTGNKVKSYLHTYIVNFKMNKN